MLVDIGQSTPVNIFGYTTTLGDIGFLISLVVASMTMIAFFMMLKNKGTLTI